MKLGILGTGTIARELLPDLRDLGPEKTYLLSTPRSLEGARELVKTYRLDGAVCDYEELLGLDVDTVYVALPNNLHYEYAKRALLAGKHVILEKPAVPRRAELEELWALARERELILVEAVPMRHREGYRLLKEAMGRIGRPRLATCYYCQRSRRYDAFLRGEIHPVFDPAKAGGVLMDLNLYNIHALVGLFGTPKRVDYHANMERGIDLSGILNLDYGDLQAAALAAKDCSSPGESVFMGDEGMLLADLRQLNGYTFLSRTGEREEVRLEVDRSHRLLEEFLVFKAMIERGDLQAAEALMETSLTVSGIIEAGRRQAGILFPGDPA